MQETHLRLLRQKAVECKSRPHFFGIAALFMRRILVDEARQRNTSVRVLEQIDKERLVTRNHRSNWIDARPRSWSCVTSPAHH